jgi:exosortase F-associated protein
MFRKIVIITVLIFLLILVRVFESDMFYDPFLSYFKNDYLREDYFPDFSWSMMVLSLGFRFLLNALISIAIIYAVFKDGSILRFSIIFYILAFLLLTVVYSILIINKFEGGYLPAFYVRRFLIQPLFVFLLIPGFIYQKKYSKNQ